MKRDRMRGGLRALLGLGAVWMVACGAPLPEEAVSPEAENMATQAQRLCSGLSVDGFSLEGVSSFEGELAGAGDWQVSGGANGVRLEYSIDGSLYASEERTGPTGPWFFSQAGVSCGLHSFEAKAYPLTIDSNGNRTTCFQIFKSLFQNVTQPCPGVSESLSGGSSHTVSLRADGTVWTSGANSYGQLGNGKKTQSSVRVQVRGLSNVIAVSAGAYHSVALTEDGTVWTWGHNAFGQLGDGTTTHRVRPVQVAGLSDVVAVVAANYHTAALTKDGQIYAWG